MEQDKNEKNKKKHITKKRNNWKKQIATQIKRPSKKCQIRKNKLETTEEEKKDGGKEENKEKKECYWIGTPEKTKTKEKTTG